MEIKNAKYYKDAILDKNICIQADVDGNEINIPMDENNRHYAEILKQVKEGTLTIKDAE